VSPAQQAQRTCILWRRIWVEELADHEWCGAVYFQAFAVMVTAALALASYGLAKVAFFVYTWTAHDLARIVTRTRSCGCVLFHQLVYLCPIEGKID